MSARPQQPDSAAGDDDDQRRVNESQTQRDSASDPVVTPLQRHNSVFGEEPRNHTGNLKLGAGLKKRRFSEEATAEAMAGSMGEGSRQRNTSESTPISSSHQDYQSIPPTRSEARSNGAAAAQEGTTGTLDRGTPQKRTSSSASTESTTTRWTQFWEKWGSVELENKGSVARDHLALERTFLAWLRTSLSFASIGIAVTQLFRLNSSLRTDTSASHSFEAQNAHSLRRLRHLGKPLGATFIGISILMLLIGFHRYFEAQHYVIRGKFPASRGSIVLVSGVAGGLIVSSLVVILATSPEAFET